MRACTVREVKVLPGEVRQSLTQWDAKKEQEDWPFVGRMEEMMEAEMPPSGAGIITEGSEKSAQLSPPPIARPKGTGTGSGR